MLDEPKAPSLRVLWDGDGGSNGCSFELSCILSKVRIRKGRVAPTKCNPEAHDAKKEGRNELKSAAPTLKTPKYRPSERECRKKPIASPGPHHHAIPCGGAFERAERRSDEGSGQKHSGKEKEKLHRQGRTEEAYGDKSSPAGGYAYERDASTRGRARWETGKCRTVHSGRRETRHRDPIIDLLCHAAWLLQPEGQRSRPTSIANS